MRIESIQSSSFHGKVLDAWAFGCFASNWYEIYLCFFVLNELILKESLSPCSKMCSVRFFMEECEVDREH